MYLLALRGCLSCFRGIALPAALAGVPPSSKHRPLSRSFARIPASELLLFGWSLRPILFCPNFSALRDLFVPLPPFSFTFAGPENRSVGSASPSSGLSCFPGHRALFSSDNAIVALVISTVKWRVLKNFQKENVAQNGPF